MTRNKRTRKSLILLTALAVLGATPLITAGSCTPPPAQQQGDGDDQRGGQQQRIDD